MVPPELSWTWLACLHCAWPKKCLTSSSGIDFPTLNASFQIGNYVKNAKLAESSARQSEGRVRKVLMNRSSMGASRATPTNRQFPLESSLLPWPPRISPCALSVVRRVLTRSGGGRYKFPAEKKNFAWNFNSTCNNNKDPKKNNNNSHQSHFPFSVSEMEKHVRPKLQSSLWHR